MLGPCRDVISHEGMVVLPRCPCLVAIVVVISGSLHLDILIHTWFLGYFESHGVSLYLLQRIGHTRTQRHLTHGYSCDDFLCPFWSWPEGRRQPVRENWRDFLIHCNPTTAHSLTRAWPNTKPKEEMEVLLPLFHNYSFTHYYFPYQQRRAPTSHNSLLLCTVCTVQSNSCGVLVLVHSRECLLVASIVLSSTTWSPSFSWSCWKSSDWKWASKAAGLLQALGRTEYPEPSFSSSSHLASHSVPSRPPNTSTALDGSYTVLHFTHRDVQTTWKENREGGRGLRHPRPSSLRLLAPLFPISSSILRLRLLLLPLLFRLVPPPLSSLFFFDPWWRFPFTRSLSGSHEPCTRTHTRVVYYVRILYLTAPLTANCGLRKKEERTPAVSIFLSLFPNHNAKLESQICDHLEMDQLETPRSLVYWHVENRVSLKRMFDLFARGAGGSFLLEIG